MPDETPVWRDRPISVGWWWLKFVDGRGSRFWDGTFWKCGSYFVAAEEYNDNPVVGPCLLPVPTDSSVADEIDEASFLARAYLLESDDRLTGAAQMLNRIIAHAIIQATLER